MCEESAPAAVARAARSRSWRERGARLPTGYASPVGARGGGGAERGEVGWVKAVKARPAAASVSALQRDKLLYACSAGA